MGFSNFKQPASNHYSIACQSLLFPMGNSMISRNQRSRTKAWKVSNQFGKISRVAAKIIHSAHDIGTSSNNSSSNRPSTGWSSVE